MNIPYVEILSHWGLQTAAMALTALLIPKLRVTSIIGPLGAVLVLGLINATVWDAALFFSIPQSLSSQAFLLFLVNGAIFWLIVKLLPGIEVDGVLPAIIAPLVFSVLSLLIHHFGRDIDWPGVFSYLLELMRQLRVYFSEGQAG